MILGHPRVKACTKDPGVHREKAGARGGFHQSPPFVASAWADGIVTKFYPWSLSFVKISQIVPQAPSQPLPHTSSDSLPAVLVDFALVQNLLFFKSSCHSN